MKHYLKRAFMGFAMLTAVMGLSTILAACNGSADAATTGVTMAQVNAAIAAAVKPLKAQIADQAKQIEALQSGSDSAIKAKLSHLYVTIAAPNAQGVSRATQSYGDSSGGVHTMAVADTCSGLGTLTGHPTSSDPRTTDKLAGVSCTGYLFTVLAAPFGDNSRLMPLQSGVWYAAPNCAGPAYVAAGAISTLAQASGVAFSIKGAIGYTADSGDDDWANPAWYRYVPAGAQTVQFVPVSHWGIGETDDLRGKIMCRALVGAQPQPGYKALPNDPTVTGVPSGLIPGPVGMGTIQ